MFTEILKLILGERLHERHAVQRFFFWGGGANSVRSVENIDRFVRQQGEINLGDLQV